MPLICPSAHVALIDQPIRHRQLALARPLPLDQRALIGRPVRIGDPALALLDPQHPVAFVGIARRVGQLARAVVLAPAERAFIDRPVGIARDALAGHLALHPVALIRPAIRGDDLALALGLALDERALIDRPVRITRRALAGDLSVNPFARIFKARGQFVGPGPVLATVQESAFVDRAIVVLLGDDLSVLRKGGDGQDGKADGKGKAAHGRIPVLVGAQGKGGTGVWQAWPPAAFPCASVW